jgi:multidrug efflux pump subunit AcrA (membrane-fusion protein)
VSETADLKRLQIDRAAKAAPVRRPRSGRSGSGLLLPLLLLAAVAGAAYIFWRPIQATIDRYRLPRVRVARVEVGRAVEVGAVEGVAANGYIVASRRAALSADTPGRITELHVKEGSLVKEGDLVARLYDEEYAAALARARADKSAANATVDRAHALIEASATEVRRAERGHSATTSEVDVAQARLTLAEQEYARVERLGERGLATEQDKNQAEAERMSARAARERAGYLEASAAVGVEAARQQQNVATSELAVATAQLAVAEANREQAEATLKKTEVRAPFTGIVVLKDAEVGEVVSPNVQGGSNARGSVVTMVDFASLEVQEIRYDGKVSRIWPVADRQKATIEVRVTLDRLDERLRPDMGVRVVFLPPDAPVAEDVEATAAVDFAKESLLVPAEALVRVDGKEGAFVAERGRVRFQPVAVAARRGGQVVIEGGLEAGQLVVLEPPTDLGAGDRVQYDAP